MTQSPIFPITRDRITPEVIPRNPWLRWHCICNILQTTLPLYYTKIQCCDRGIKMHFSLHFPPVVCYWFTASGILSWINTVCKCMSEDWHWKVNGETPPRSHYRLLLTSAPTITANHILHHWNLGLLWRCSSTLSLTHTHRHTHTEWDSLAWLVQPHWVQLLMLTLGRILPLDVWKSSIMIIPLLSDSSSLLNCDCIEYVVCCNGVSLGVCVYIPRVLGFPWMVKARLGSFFRIRVNIKWYLCVL